MSLTIFLSNPSDYDGGELVLELPFGERAIKLPAGSGVLYSTTALHRVTEVTRGERLAVVTWVRSYIWIARAAISHPMVWERPASAEPTMKPRSPKV